MNEGSEPGDSLPIGSIPGLPGSPTSIKEGINDLIDHPEEFGIGEGENNEDEDEPTA